MRLIAAILAGLTLAAAPGARAQTPPEGLVWMALNAINADQFDRDDPTNRPPLVTRVPEGMLRPVEVSPDGLTDWLVDFDAAGLSAFCGTGGCVRVLYVSGGDTGFIRAFDAQALAFDVVRRDGEMRVEAQVHHLNCRSGQSECLYAWAWDAERHGLIERPAADGLTRLEGGGFNPLAGPDDDLPDTLPAELSEVWFAGRLTCQDHSDDGSVTLRPEFRSVPDIDGDGRRDWIEIPPMCETSNVGVIRFSLWVTAGDGALEQVYQSRSDRLPSIDIGSTPATVIETAVCDLDQSCPDTRLRWVAGQRQFVVADR